MPVISIKNLYKEYTTGDITLQVLKNINLDIEAGELVAIIGASGSGKSTLMNILGCLDKPTSGHYYLNGHDIKTMDADQLAKLRRDYFGFIFQRYHLLTSLNALENVEIPAIYSGVSNKERKERAEKILQNLGLGDKTKNNPNQLSGGQQQRVSIARALMNGGNVILADEPTGALDSHSGKQVIQTLKDLNKQGHTVIIVTHDHNVAAHANRIIEIKDGEIIADTKKEELVAPTLEKYQKPTTSLFKQKIDQLVESFKMSVNSILSHKLRSFLTMLGIIIGIASVVSVVALGQGSREKILADISAMGTNTIDIYPGEGFGDRKSASVRTLNTRDVELLRKQNYIDSVSPNVNSTNTITFKNISVNGQIKGVDTAFFQVKDLEMEKGQIFDDQAVEEQAQYVVIDKNTQKKLFLENEDPIGQIILIKNVPAKIIGVTKEKKSAFGNDENLNLWMPYTTVMHRLTGTNHLQSITVRVSDDYSNSAAETGIIDLITARHGIKDFFTLNTDSIRETVEKTTATLTLLISAIAVISLVVGGIGVMNIMLVSVTERTKEIGIRMAIGARQNDILQQFLIEAVLVCMLGGILGVGLSMTIGLIFNNIVTDFSMVYSTSSIITAFTCSTLIGIIFGFLPAKNAAKLDPIVALSRE